MMKRICIVIVISLICSLATGCTGGEIQTLQEQNDSLKKQVTELEEQKQKPASWYKSEEFSQALKLFDEFIETNDMKLGISKDDVLQLVKLDKVSDRHFLTAYMIAPVQPLTNNFYALVDIDKGECIQINLDSVDYINEIAYDKDFISFYCEGQNVIDGFRKFPHIIKYDIAKKEVTTEYPYKSMKASEPEIALGNGINKVGLRDAIENNKTILFSFNEVKGTIVAGGVLCPSIKTGLKQDGNEEDRTLYIDIEALVLSEEARQKLMNLKDIEYISDISVRNYTDVHDIAHVAVYFKFKGIQEYCCSFQEGSGGFTDFMLMLK